MNEIRPTLPDVASRAPASGPSAAARTAQAAFFQAALGAAVRPGMATQLAAQAAVAPPSIPMRAEAAPTAPAADRPMRPGSLLDIRV